MKEKYFDWEFYERCSDCEYELERRITVPPIISQEGFTWADIEDMEQDLWVCPSGCGYHKYPDEPLYPINLPFDLDDDLDGDDPPQLPLKVEMKNMFTGEYEVIYDAQPSARENRIESLAMEPFPCPNCETEIKPMWEEYYDAEDNTVYHYYHHYCIVCQYENLEDREGNSVTHIGEMRYNQAEQERQAHERLYDRRLL